jgi:IgGFc binding protein
MAGSARVLGIRGMGIVAAAIVLISAGSARAAVSSAGTDFWLGFPDAQQGSTPQFVLELTGTAAASGTVSVPGTTFSQTFNVTPGTNTNVSIPLSAEDTTNDAVETGQAIHVISDASVTVDAMYEDPGLSDGYLGLATPVLGTSYIVATVPGNANCGSSQFEVVGTQAETTVTITPSVAIGGHGAGNAYTEQLGAGSTYLGQAAGTGNPSGTQIVASEPVAVFAGSSCGQVPVGVGFANALMEEEAPVSDWGTEFFTLPFATRTAGDEYVIVTSQPDTTIERNGSFLESLGAADSSFSQFFTSPSHITADKPILIEHLATGSEYMSDGQGDPTMIDVLPATLYTRIQTVTTPATGFANNYLNVTIAKSDIGTLTLDGKPVSASAFSLVGDSSTEAGAQISVQGGEHVLEAAGPLGVEAYGFDPASEDAYGFPGALGNPDRAPAPEITINAPANGATYRAGQPVRASYSCTAATGTTISQCAGSVVSGAAVTTIVPGAHTFTVRATDGYGGASTASVSYTVAAPSNRIKVNTSKLNLATGTVTVTVSVPGPGMLAGLETIPSGRKRAIVSRVHLTASKVGRFKLTFKPSRKVEKLLKKRHKLAVVIAVTYAPTYGTSRTTTLHLTVRLKR